MFIPGHGQGSEREIPDLYFLPLPHPGSKRPRIQGPKRHQIPNPDPQHWKILQILRLCQKRRIWMGRTWMPSRRQDACSDPQHCPGLKKLFVTSEPAPRQSLPSTANSGLHFCWLMSVPSTATWSKLVMTTAHLMNILPRHSIVFFSSSENINSSFKWISWRTFIITKSSCLVITIFD